MSDKGADKSKQKQFDFRMSKKVAELTQVVHMLFTRNHEREVELEALKDAYEHEIDIVISDAKSRISALERQISDTGQMSSHESEKLKALHDAMMKKKEEEWEKRLENKEKNLQHEKKECQKLHDMLIDAQKDIEKLRQGADSQLSTRSEELAAKNKEIEKLRKTIAIYEKKLKDNERQADEAIKELEAVNNTLTEEMSQLQELLEETAHTKEQVIMRNKQLEADMKNLKRELTKRFNEMANQKMNHQQFDQKIPQRQTNYMEYNDELERLRREVQRYRMELSNREGNFNRMFTEKKPVVVDRTAGKIAMQHHSLLQGPSLHVAAPSGPFMKREKTISYAITQGYDASLNQELPVRSTSSMSRLPPMLSMDTKTRMSRLVKPRPPPKELLSSK